MVAGRVRDLEQMTRHLGGSYYDRAFSRYGVRFAGQLSDMLIGDQRSQSRLRKLRPAPTQSGPSLRKLYLGMFHPQYLVCLTRN